MKHEIAAAFSMWRREVLRFMRAKSRVVGSLGMPFFLLAIMGTGLNGVMPVGGLSYLDFIAPGILGMVIMFGSVFSGVTVIMDRQFGFLRETLVAPVSRLSIVAGKSVGGATTAILQGLLMMVVAVIIGAQFQLSGIPLAIMAMFMVSVSFVSLGIAIASLMEDMHGFQLVMNFLIMPMFFLSGALFPLDSAPEIVRWVSFIDPLTYAVDMFRFLLTGSSSMPIAISAGAAAAFTVITTAAAAWLFSRIEG